MTTAAVTVASKKQAQLSVLDILDFHDHWDSNSIHLNVALDSLYLSVKCTFSQKCKIVTLETRLILSNRLILSQHLILHSSKQSSQ